MGICSSTQSEQHKQPDQQDQPNQFKQSIDLKWDSDDLWLCDIDEYDNEEDCDFLFLAKITSDGSSHKTEEYGRCIFQDRMYDIQSFNEDVTYDGKLDFEIWFGRNTKERQDAPNGWNVKFKDLVRDQKKYSGKIVTSWWGERNVTLINYSTLSDIERTIFPDLLVPAKSYYVSQS